MRRHEEKEMEKLQLCAEPNWQKPTLRFRHDLQFMDSRESELARRAGSRSMLT